MKLPAVPTVGAIKRAAMYLLHAKIYFVALKASAFDEPRGNYPCTRL